MYGAITLTTALTMHHAGTVYFLLLCTSLQPAPSWCIPRSRHITSHLFPLRHITSTQRNMSHPYYYVPHTSHVNTTHIPTLTTCPPLPHAHPYHMSYPSTLIICHFIQKLCAALRSLSYRDRYLGLGRYVTGLIHCVGLEFVLCRRKIIL